MSDYVRKTQECFFQQLRPEIQSSMREAAEQNGWEHFESDILLCCETTNERVKKGPFNLLNLIEKDKVHTVGIVLTPKLLVWTRSGEKSGVTTIWAKLKDIEVTDFVSPLPNFSDSGLSVFGFIARNSERGTVFIGLGPEGAAERFRQAVKDEVRKAQS